MSDQKCYNCKSKDPRATSVFCSEKCKNEYGDKNNIPVPPNSNQTSFDQRLADFKKKYKIVPKTDDEKMAEVAWSNIERIFSKIDKQEQQNIGTR